MQSDGKILVAGAGGVFAGTVPHFVAVIRYNSDGTLDGSFTGPGGPTNGAGQGATHNGYATGMVLQPDGRVVLSGSNFGESHRYFTLDRYSATGTLDISQYTGIGIANDSANSVALQGDGKIILAGQSYDANSAVDAFALVRYNPDGTLDTGFHSIGKVSTRIGSGAAYINSVAVQADGRIVAAGLSYSGANQVFTLARYYGTEQPPIVQTGVATVAKTTATLKGSANPNSLATTAYFEYGLDTNYGSVTPSQICGNGTTPVALNAGISLLSPNTTYHFRLVAMNSAALNSGITYGADVVLRTDPDPPLAFTSDALSVGATGATLAGVVVPNGRDTEVYFEYGLTTAYGSVTPAQSISAANNLMDVFAQVTGLDADATYHFRLIASNSGSPLPTRGEDKSFQAKPPLPTTITGGAFSLSTTSAGVNGSVRANNSTTQVFFEYGTDGVTFPTRVSAGPNLSGDTDTAVSAVLSNLAQGVTYFYRVRAENAGGTNTGEIFPLALDVLSGFQQVAPSVLDPRSGAQGFLVVNLSPSNLTGTGWRFVGEQQWRVPGVPAGGLATGNREIEFRPVAGFLHPLREPVSVTSGAAATVVEREYFQGGGVATASLSVTLLPVSLGAAAQWRLLGEGDSAWRASGASLGGLAAGVYLVECKDVAGFTTPRPISVTIGSGEAKSATATYFLADAAVGAQPGVVGFDTVTSVTANPSTYVGQLRSDSGAGTGFVVRERVVATAAHVVFDDVSFSAVTGLQWLFQRERGTYEPVPQIPRGSYILSGYSAARQSAGVIPGQSTADSQNLDVASVWFHEKDEQDNPLDPLAARGGKGGYLASDSTDNEWLISPRLKTIVGYPLDGIAAANQGRIHATPPINATFTHANARVFLTDAITLRGGNSGGPVCVQYDDGRYFPAAIYLGGTTQTRVRAIDSDVITLFDSAEESSTTGQNSTNGGSTQTNNSLGSTPSGTLTVTIEPQSARAAGAGWRIGSGAFLNSGQSKPFLSAGDYNVTFKSIEGFQTPSARSVTVEAGKTTRLAITYNLPSAPSAVAVPTYTGLIIGTEGVAGQVVAGITKSKRLTLKLRIGSESLMITGVFDASGTFSGSISRRGKASALVTLAFDPDLVAQLSGEITLDGISYDLSAGKSLFQTKNPTSLAGKYTFVLPRDPGFSDPTTRPFGNGYALGSVSSRGAVSVAGVLGDGTAFTFSAPLFADATCPVYVQPYAKHGLLAGTLVFHDATTPDIASADGTLLWQKPATTKGLYKPGFTGSTATLGSRWTPPPKNTAALDIANWNLAIGNGVLVPPLTGTVTLSPANLFTPPVPGTKLTLAPKTGLLSGSFPGTNGKPVKFNGALLQSQSIGRGVFALPDKTGPVTLDPPP